MIAAIRSLFSIRSVAALLLAMLIAISPAVFILNADIGTVLKIASFFMAVGALPAITWLRYKNWKGLSSYLIASALVTLILGTFIGITMVFSFPTSHGVVFVVLIGIITSGFLLLCPSLIVSLVYWMCAIKSTFDLRASVMLVIVYMAWCLLMTPLSRFSS